MEDQEILAFLTARPHSPLSRDIRQLRRTIRQTHRKMQDGTLDFRAGAALLSRLSNSLAQLQLAEHRISPASDNDPWTKVRELFQRILAEEPQHP
jgi:hypothetical protein